MSAQVAGYQHALTWNPSNPLELFVGQRQRAVALDGCDRPDGIGVRAADAGHFQNLNGGLGSLAEVESMSPVGASPYTMMAGLGANGTAGVKGHVRGQAETGRRSWAGKAARWRSTQPIPPTGM